MVEAESLTVDQVSGMLGLSRNTVYKLAKEGEIPSYRLGRKLRFSRQDVVDSILSKPSDTVLPESDIDLIASSLAEASGPRIKVAGNDILSGVLAHHLSQQGCPSAVIPMNSYAALVNLYAGSVGLAMINLYDFRTNTCNVPYVQRLCPGTSVKVIRLLSRKQGLFVKRGNPKQITRWGSLLRDDIRIAARRKGSGSQVLLDQKFTSLEMSMDKILDRVAVCETAGQAIARVSAGSSDVCVGFKEEATAHPDVQFIPMMTESIDVVVRKDAYLREAAKALEGMANSRQLKDELQRFMECDVTQTGAVVYEC